MNEKPLNSMGRFIILLSASSGGSPILPSSTTSHPDAGYIYPAVYICHIKIFKLALNKPGQVLEAV